MASCNRTKPSFILFASFVLVELQQLTFAGISTYSRAIDFRSYFSPLTQPLSLEKIWEIDPGQPNPHLQRWILGRKIEPEGMTAFLRADKKYGVFIAALSSTQSAYLRPAGPWYFSYDTFRCDPKLDLGFGNEEGAKRSLGRANELWLQNVLESKDRLSQSLAMVATDSSDLALKRGDQIFLVWLGDVEHRWREDVARQVRSSEWDFYVKSAKELGYCKKPAKDQSPRLLRSIMEPAEGTPPEAPKLLARAPVRLWNGLFTIRAEIEVADKKLNGRFLVDSTANKSLINPDWVRSQGIPPEWIKIPNVPLQYVRWNRSENKNETLAPRAWVTQVTVSGLKLPLHEFSLLDTEIFAPPESIGSCCDGVFGIDLLKLFPVEFMADKPAELRIWPKEQFRGPLNMSWLQLSLTTSQEIISQCSIGDSKQREFPSPPQSLRWDLGSEEPLVVRENASNNNTLKIRCDELYDIATDLPAVKASGNGYGNQSARLPRAGASLLSRGNFVLDLPHGKLWFDPRSLYRALPKKNNSGLLLDFVFVDGDRVLKVVKIGSKDNLQPLKKAGLKPGMVIQKINGRPADELDLWEVNLILSGEFGDKVTLSFLNKKEVRDVQLVILP